MKTAILTLAATLLVAGLSFAGGYAVASNAEAPACAPVQVPLAPTCVQADDLTYSELLRAAMTRQCIC